MKENNYTIEYIIENKIDKNAYGFIYITTNLVNGKKYIGQKMFRKDYNKKNWMNYLGSGSILKLAIKKYGKNNFIRDILVISYSKEELDDLETRYIANYNAVNDKNFYNILFGGQRGGVNPYLNKTEDELEAYKVSRSANRRKAWENMSGEDIITWKKNLSENNCKYWLGRKHSESSKLKIGLASIRRNPRQNKTELEKIQWSNKMRESQINMPIEKRNRMNKQLSDARMGSNNPNAKKIICLTTMKIFDYVKEACICYSLSHHLSEALTSKKRFYGKLNGKKLEWMYYSDYIKLQEAI